MLEFLPNRIQNALKYCNRKFVYELRLRAERPIMLNYQGKYCFLGIFGVTDKEKEALICSYEEVDDCLFKAGNYSIYSVEEQIKQGFITANGGVRIGLAGEYVFDQGKVLSIRNISSLCIRIPHEIYDCSEKIYQSCMSDRIHNTLLSSPPGLGKTTILRDLSRKIAEKTSLNLLICDERGEIAVGDVGKSCDVIKYCDKNTAFSSAIRAMRPDIIITDELSALDCEALEKAVCAGIKIIASAHFSEMEYVKSPFLGLFERFVFLQDEIGNVARIYDRTGKEIHHC